MILSSYARSVATACGITSVLGSLQSSCADRFWGGAGKGGGTILQGTAAPGDGEKRKTALKWMSVAQSSGAWHEDDDATT